MTFICDYCKKTFATNFSLKRHAHTQHSPKKYDLTKTENEGEKESSCDESSSSETKYTMWNNSFWRHILVEACNRMHNLPDSIDDMLKEPFYSNLIKMLRVVYLEYVTLIHSFNNSDLREQLHNTKEYFIKKLHTNPLEAEDMIWSSNIFPFKTLITKNLDLFQNESKSE